MGEGSYANLFSSSDVTEFHRMKYGGGGLIIITLFSLSDVTAFHRIFYDNHDIYIFDNLVIHSTQKFDLLNHKILAYYILVSDYPRE